MLVQVTPRPASVPSVSRCWCRVERRRRRGPRSRAACSEMSMARRVAARLVDAAPQVVEHRRQVVDRLEHRCLGGLRQRGRRRERVPAVADRRHPAPGQRAVAADPDGHVGRLGVGGLAPGGEVVALVGELVLGPDPPDDRQRLVEQRRCARRSRRRGRGTRPAGSRWRRRARTARPTPRRASPPPWRRGTGCGTAARRCWGSRCSRSVTAATTPRATNGSRASWPPACSHRCDGAGWSVKPTPSKPSSSARVANRTIASFVTSSGL